MDRVARIYAGADRRRPWEDMFFDQSFSTPLEQQEAGPYAAVLEAVRLAPSASNKQPWRIIKEGHIWHLYIQRTRKYPPSIFKLLINGSDLQQIDLGIAMAHFDLSAKENQITGKWLDQDPQLVLPNELTEYCISWIPDQANGIKGQEEK